MSTTIGKVQDRDEPMIELEVYTSGGITLFITGVDGTSYKMRLNEESTDKLMELLVIAARQQGYKGNWIN